MLITQARGTWRTRASPALVDRYGIYVALVGLLIRGGDLRTGFLQLSNLANVLRTAAVLGVVAIDRRS